MQRTDPLGRIDPYAYDAAGNLTTATDRRGAVTTVTYDGLNRPVTAAVTVPWNAALNRSISYTYDALDRLDRGAYPLEAGGGFRSNRESPRAYQRALTSSPLDSHFAGDMRRWSILHADHRKALELHFNHGH